MKPAMRWNKPATPQRVFSRVGFTLVETLTSIAIVTVLALLVVAGLGYARKAGAVGDDLNNLRQLGLAAALYAEQTGEYPRSARWLVKSGLAPKAICSSKTDLTRVGTAKVWSDCGMAARLVGSEAQAPPYRLSYLGHAEVGITPYIAKTFIQPNDAGGWLVSFGTFRPQGPCSVAGEGTYHRLLFTGSVVSRTSFSRPCDNPPINRCWPVSAVFFDPKEDYLKWLERH